MSRFTVSRGLRSVATPVGIVLLATFGLSNGFTHLNLRRVCACACASTSAFTGTGMLPYLNSFGRHLKADCHGSVPLSSSSMSSSNNHNGIADLRKEYSKQGLLESSIPSDPFDLFSIWFDEARNANVLEPNAMCLSTCKDNKPTARYVLLKAQDKRGFVWFTNYESRKGADLEANPNAALTFWWGDLERSVRIEGSVVCVSAEESDEYFQSRPRSSQVGAWSSQQSREIDNRDALEQQEVDIKARFEGSSFIPRPSHWGGYRLVPSRIEFWKGRESRLHDRIVFTRDIENPDKWHSKRLQP